MNDVNGEFDIDDFLTKAFHEANSEGDELLAKLQANPKLVLFECFLDRAETQIPSDYLPGAEGVLIAGETILSAAGYRQGSYRPRGWWKRDYANYLRRSRHNGNLLWIRACGDFWLIQRNQFHFGQFCGTYALCCAFSRRPIWTRTYQAAIRIAEHCDPFPHRGP